MDQTVTARQLLELLQNLPLLESLLTWALSHVAEKWPWFQSNTEVGKRWIMLGLCFIIALISKVALFALYGGDVPLVDQVATLIYTFGTSYVVNQVTYARTETVRENRRKSMGLPPER